MAKRSRQFAAHGLSVGFGPITANIDLLIPDSDPCSLESLVGNAMAEEVADTILILGYFRAFEEFFDNRGSSERL